jgi:hypothetical protein
MFKSFSKLFNKDKKPIVVVSGLPRSGTSLMMKMLEVGGIPPLTDKIRTADDDNPKGYYEFERVKKLKDGDTAWLPEAEGKAVKVISALLSYLPADYQYKVIFMQRSLPEVLASQGKMLVNREEDPDRVSDEELARLFEKHLAEVTGWLAQQPNISTHYLSYNELVADPTPHIQELDRFLPSYLDTSLMGTVIDPALYRQRA